MTLATRGMPTHSISLLFYIFSEGYRTMQKATPDVALLLSASSKAASGLL
jgi:hypothetical protein